MKGEKPSQNEFLIPPQGITLRESSDTLAVEDPIVVRALQMIREQACEGISVQQLIDELQISRSSLERRFQKSIRHSPQNEIRRVQFKKS